jgi:hypothetical protein
MAAIKRTCGSCTQCCKAFAVRELAKPANRWCRHCAIGKGCAVYADRPLTCRQFACGWLLNPLPDELRPDRSKVVMFEPATMPGVLAMHVDPGRPDAWRQGGVARIVKEYVGRGGEVRVIVGGAAYRVTRDGVSGPHAAPDDGGAAPVPA